MCSLFDDFGFEDFVDSGATKIGIPNSLIFELSKLRELLNSYIEKVSDEEIRDGPECGWLFQQVVNIV